MKDPFSCHGVVTGGRSQCFVGFVKLVTTLVLTKLRVLSSRDWFREFRGTFAELYI